MKSRIPLAIGAACVTLVLGACASGSPSASTGSASSAGGVVANGDTGGNGTGKTFTMALDNDPGSLNPNKVTIAAAKIPESLMYASLLTTKLDGTVLPEMASRWKSTPTKVVFTLKKGITCSDGTPLTAADIAADINWVANKKNGSTFYGSLVQAGTKAVANDAKNTITVTAPSPSSFLEQTIGTLPIVCKKGLSSPDFLNHNSSGTGLYYMVNAQPGSKYTLQRRKDVTWGPKGFDASDANLPDKVVFQVVANNTTTANLLATGAVNAGLVEPPDQVRLQQMNLTSSQKLTAWGTFFFNEGSGHLTADLAVRKAIIAGLDLAQIGKVLGGGTGRLLKSFTDGQLPPICDGDTITGNIPKFDTKSAAEMLDKDGWKVGAGGIRAKDGKQLKIKLVYFTSPPPTNAAAAELIQKQLKSIGVDVTLKGSNSTGYFATLDSDEWDFTIVADGQVYPNQLASLLTGAGFPDHGTNFTNADHPEYDRLRKQANNKVGNASCSDWVAAQASMVKELAFLPFFASPQYTFGNGASMDPAYTPMFGWSIKMTAKK